MDIANVFPDLKETPLQIINAGAQTLSGKLQDLFAMIHKHIYLK